MKKEKVRNIFSGIIDDENSTTELLRNLMTIKVFRNKLLGIFLKPNELDRINGEDFDTQSSLSDENGRPDMTVVNDEYEILFEIKINDASLTKNQPTKYFTYLLSMPNKKKWLIFIVPDSYLCLNELKKRLKCMNRKYSGYQIGVKIIYWRNIIKLLRDNKKVLKGVIFDDFLALLEERYGMRKIDFNKGEVRMLFNKKVSDGIVKLYNIIDDLSGYYNDYFGKNHKIVKKLKNNIYGAYDEEYGLYFINSRGRAFFYIGVWFGFWSKYGKPICYGIDCSEATEKTKKIFDSINKGHYKPLDGWHMSWIDNNYLKNIDIANLAKVIDVSLRPIIAKSK